ncbi:MAG: hypothetical protein M1820_009252 [Bogoriella megaspora]|nr:MAG: hypothetical protein M1820_009252 [Bogoriella megaspora]
MPNLQCATIEIQMPAMRNEIVGSFLPLYPNNKVSPHISCSLSCFKPHKAQHQEEVARNHLSASVTPSVQNEEVSRIEEVEDASDQRQEPSAPAHPDFSALPSSPSLAHLLTKYPALRFHLRDIYAATLEPSTMDEYHKPKGLPAPNFSRMEVRESRRRRGPWRQEIGDEDALGVMRRLCEAVDVDERESEGLREFVDLVGVEMGRRQEDGGLGG